MAASSRLWWDVPYGPDGTTAPEGSRFLRLHKAPACMPAGEAHGTVCVIHGGFWKNRYGLDDEYGNAGCWSVAPFFLRRGFSAVEVEYRRRDHEGGGWPGTNEDVLAALRKLEELHREPQAGSTAVECGDGAFLAAARALRPGRVVLVGHSAGGCLALWAAHQLVDPGALRVALTLAAAPVADLVLGHELKISDEGDAVERYMGRAPDGEAALAEYARASPAALLPVRSPLVVAFGGQDADVPPAAIEGYAAAAKSQSPDLVAVVQLEDADHFDVVSARSAAWLEHIAPALAGLAEAALGVEAAAALRARYPEEEEEEGRAA
ncbi:unnamed protein product [Prorocentrum cordatum]|uniref:Peptidase S9 prolyl oligopeptidase catalytic domain-containing protein n=1 Tax=Prorocentrum cordatum TaxID=2364126 RepID=A0ABN9X8D5_9DINO|nr:unnamed protein product [Polarella glacialis]